MAAFVLCAFAPLIFIGYVSERRIDSPLFMFPTIWGIISFLAAMRLYNLIEVSTSTFIMIVLGTYAFVCGCLITRRRRLAIFLPKQRDEHSLAKKMILMQLFALIIFIYSSTSAIILLHSGASISDIYNMRIQMAYGSTTALTSKSSIISILLEYYARPVLAISIPYSAIKLIRDRSKMHFILTISMLLLSFISRGNRLDILCFVLTIGFAFRLLNQKFDLSAKQKRYIIIFSIVGAVLILILSNLRGDFNLGKSIYMYLCGNVPFADIKLHDLGTSIEHTYFATSLQGITRFINQIFEVLKIGEVKLFSLAEQYAFVETAETITTTGGLYNAFVGPFYFFYCDGGWIGIIILSFVNGVISEHIYREAYCSEDTIMRIIYLIVIVRGVFFSFYNYLFASIMYGMALIILLIIGKTSKERNRNRVMEDWK